MSILYISATELKQKISEVLNNVYYMNHTTIIERHGKPLAKIVPIDMCRHSHKKIDALLKRSFGSIPDFPDVKKYRRGRRRRLPSL